MYIIRSDIRNAYLTSEGWTTIESGVLMGLHNVLRFTKGEVNRNEHKLGKGQRFMYFPLRKWKDYE